MMHWWAAYAAALPEPGPPPLINVNDDTQPSLRAKYDRAFAPAGLSALVASSLSRTKAKLAAADANSMRGFVLSVERCSRSGPALLTMVATSSKKICVAPILASSLFFQSVGTEMQRLYQQLRNLGVDPANFTGDYESRLNQRGITRADWEAMLGAYEAEWARLQGASDYLSAYLVSCDVLGRAKAKCAKEAAPLAAAASGRLELSALQSSIASASDRYDPASWGFRTAGDGRSVADELAAIRADPAAR